MFPLDEQELDQITGLPVAQSNPELQTAQPDLGPPLPAPAPPEMNPAVKDYLLKKFDLGQYTDENRQKLVAENAKTNVGDVIGTALTGFGESLARRDPTQALDSISNARKAKGQASLDAFDKGRTGKVQEYELNKSLTKDNLDFEAQARERDPNSAESKLAQEAARTMGAKGDLSKLTADKFKSMGDIYAKIYAAHEKKLDRQDARDAKKQERIEKGSEGQKAVDKDFAKDYNDWTSVGRAGLLKNLEALKEARAALKADSSLSGGFTGALPDRLTSDRVLKQRQKVGGAIQGALKATLGSAFTDKEGERVLKNAYNEAASPQTNMESLDAQIKQLEAAGRNNEEKAKYFEQHGSLKGYEGASTTSKAPDGHVRMRAPDGSVRDVPESKVKEYEAKGAVRA